MAFLVVSCSIDPQIKANISTSNREDSGTVGFAHEILSKAGILSLIRFADILEDQGAICGNSHPGKEEEPYKRKVKMSVHSVYLTISSTC